MKAVSYSAAELRRIEAILANPKISGNDWDSPALAKLRTKIRKYYAKEQSARCCYCTQQIMSDSGLAWDVEHVVPKSLRPDFMFEPLNLAAACKDCNTAKRVFQVLANPRRRTYPKESDRFVIVHPHFDTYDEHLRFKDYVFSPLTTKGLQTMVACNLVRITELAARLPLGSVSDERFEPEVNAIVAAHSSAEPLRVKLNIVGQDVEVTLTVAKRRKGVAR